MLLRPISCKSALFSLGFFFTLAGCSKEPVAEQKEQPTEPDRELLEPAEQAKPMGRCRDLVDLKGLSLRASTSASNGPVPVEVGDVTDAFDGIAVGVLRSGSESKVAVEWFDGKGREAQIDLGVVHGGVEPPRLLGLEDALIVALTDNDAGHSTIRLAKITRSGSEFAVTWGAQVQRRRSESLGLSLAASPAEKGSKSEVQVALVWEASEPRTLKSVLKGLTFSPATMEVVTPDKQISLPSDDAAEPLLSSSRRGFWLTWLSYGTPPVQGPARDSTGLVDEPSRTLKIQRLGAGLEPLGEGLNVSQRDVLAFDGTESQGAFVTFYRDGSKAPDGRSSLHGSRIFDDGSMEHGEVTTDSSGPGAPLILAGDEPWLLSTGKEDEIFLATVSGPLDQIRLAEEGNLLEMIPLHRSGSRLVAMRPQGLDLEITLLECGSPPSKAAPKASTKPPESKK